jgi:hypothetical protein
MVEGDQDSVHDGRDLKGRSFAAGEDQVKVVGSLPTLDVIGFKVGVQDVGDKSPRLLLNDPSARHPGCP